MEFLDGYKALKSISESRSIAGKTQEEILAASDILVKIGTAWYREEKYPKDERLLIFNGCKNLADEIRKAQETEQLNFGFSGEQLDKMMAAYITILDREQSKCTDEENEDYQLNTTIYEDSYIDSDDE